jgi:hypothetical protein
MSPDQGQVPQQQHQCQTMHTGFNALEFFANVALATAPPSYWARFKLATPNCDGADERQRRAEGDEIIIDTDNEGINGTEDEEDNMNISAGNEFADDDSFDDVSNKTADKDNDMGSSGLEDLGSDVELEGFDYDIELDFPDEDHEAERSSVSLKGKSQSPAPVRRQSYAKPKGDSTSENTVEGKYNLKQRFRRGPRSACNKRVGTRVQRRIQSQEAPEETIYKNIDDKENNEGDQQLVKSLGIEPDMEDLFASLEGVDLEKGERIRVLPQHNCPTLYVRRPRNNDFFCGLSQYPELIIELCMYLRCRDFVSLYAISKDFHETANGHMTHIMKTYASHNAPESAKIFVFTFYDHLCMPDPTRYPHPRIPDRVRKVPSLKWLQMVMHRERAVRDILACMAREGFRMPKSMSLTLKKTWLTMDISTCAGRARLMHNEKFWTDFDLYNFMMFVIKLDLRCNDPVANAGDDGLRKLFLGQRGLTPLRNLLKRTAYFDILEIIELAVRYEYPIRPEHLWRRFSIFGIPWNDIGRGHLEGWGVGRAHLYRVDELMLRESVRRGLRLDDHFEGMMLWGYVDPITKRNIMVTDEEKYMSEDDEDEYECRSKTMEGADDGDFWGEFDAHNEEDEIGDDLDEDTEDADDGADGDANEWDTETEDLSAGDQSAGESGD